MMETRWGWGEGGKRERIVVGEGGEMQMQCVRIGWVRAGERRRRRRERERDVDRGGVCMFGWWRRGGPGLILGVRLLEGGKVEL